MEIVDDDGHQRPDQVRHERNDEPHAQDIDDDEGAALLHVLLCPRDSGYTIRRCGNSTNSASSPGWIDLRGKRVMIAAAARQPAASASVRSLPSRRASR